MPKSRPLTLSLPAIDADEDGLARGRRAFYELWNEAKTRYQQDSDPVDSALAEDLWDCASADEVSDRIEEQLEAFEMFRNRGRQMMRMLNPIVHVLIQFSDVAAEAASVRFLATSLSWLAYSHQ